LALATLVSGALLRATPSSETVITVLQSSINDARIKIQTRPHELSDIVVNRLPFSPEDISGGTSTPVLVWSPSNRERCARNRPGFAAKSQFVSALLPTKSSSSAIPGVPSPGLSAAAHLVIMACAEVEQKTKYRCNGFLPPALPTIQSTLVTAASDYQ
jgi:hypothetical protein